MRIISGLHKGRKLSAPKKLPVRPTTDMAKEALFNILNNIYYFDELSVLDLFSGTGNISYEFASRGTEDITSVDNHIGCVKFIEQTSEALDMPINAVKANAYSYLEKTTHTYSIIFADPPYDFSLDQFERIPNLVFENKLLKDDGILIIEHSKHTDLSHIDRFDFYKQYGGNRFSFFK